MRRLSAAAQLARSRAGRRGVTTLRARGAAGAPERSIGSASRGGAGSSGS